MLHNSADSSKWSKILVGCLTLSVLITSSYTAATSQSNEFRDNCREKCHTEKCGKEALKLIKLMDEQVDPCENFYDFVCGSYVKNKVLEESDTSASAIVDIQNTISIDVLTDLDEEIQEGDWDAFRKVKTYYKNCMDSETTEQLGSKPLQSLLNAIGGWPVVLGNRWDERRFDLRQTLYKVEEMGMRSFFPAVISVDFDNIDTSKFALNVDGANLLVNAAWFSDKTDHNKVSRVFTDMLLKVATILGARNDSTTRKELQEITDFEIKLFNLSTPMEKLVEMPLEQSRMTIGELTRKSPGIPWLEIINQILRPVNNHVNEEEYVYVLDPKFLTQVPKLIQRTPKRVLANFIAWRIAQKHLTHLSEEFSNAYNEYDNMVKGTVGETDKRSSCYSELLELFPVGVSAMYVNKHFNLSNEAEVVEMFENIRSEARKTFQQNDWMDDRTKQLALEKLDAMNLTVGYHKELRDERTINEYYHEVEINPGSIFDSALNMSRFLGRLELNKLGKPSIQYKWAMKPDVVELNAYNVFNENSIELPAGFLKYFFSSDKPKYMNYGLSGAFLGHEFFHGFDNRGKRYDKRGNQMNWWQPEAEEKFKQRAQCIIDQYSNFTVPQVNMKVNGEISQGENIADNGGFRAGYLAYKEWSRRHNVVEGCLPSLNYTPEQMFWISSASIWCAKERPEYVIASMTTDEHSPNVARVNVVMSNIKEFSDDFKCRLGSKMNPHKKCKVW